MRVTARRVRDSPAIHDAAGGRPDLPGTTEQPTDTVGRIARIGQDHEAAGSNPAWGALKGNKYTRRNFVLPVRELCACRRFWLQRSWT